MSDLYSMNMDYVIIQVLVLEINILVSLSPDLWLKNDVYFLKKRVYYNVSFMVFTCMKMRKVSFILFISLQIISK